MKIYSVTLVARIMFVLAVTAAGAYATPLTINVPITASGGITFIAGDSPAFGDNVTIAPGVAITSGATVTADAGDDFILGSGSNITAATAIVVNLDFGNADPGTGATALLEGVLSAPAITINGGADFDVLNYLGALATVAFDAGDSTSGTISGAGIATITFHNIESVIGNVQSPTPTAVPEPASLFLVGTVLLGAQRFRKRNRR